MYINNYTEKTLKVLGLSLKIMIFTEVICILNVIKVVIYELLYRI